MKRIFLSTALILTAAILSSCFNSTSSPEKETETTAAVEPTTLSEKEIAEQKIDDRLAKMTIEEKVGQMFYVACPDVGAKEAVSEYHLGGYILFGRDFEGKTKEEITSTINEYQKAADIPLLIGVDEEGGTVVRVSRNSNLRDTPFLSPRETFADGGWQAIDADAREKAELLLSLGINVNMAPVCDITSDSDAFMYDRSFSGDYKEASEFVKRVVKISGENKLGTVLKHFPGYGSTADTHTGIAYDSREYSEFENADFKPFLAGIENGVDCVLVAHNIVNCIDSEYPASLSLKVHNILRETLGFDGVIMTDDLSMQAITDYTGADKSAVFAVKSGNDILCCSDVAVQYPAVLSAVKNNEIPESQIDNSVRRILLWKQKLGLIE